MKKLIFTLFLLSFFSMACASVDGEGNIIFTPTWIEASWTGGAMGEPNDRREEEAPEWEGQICSPNTVDLFNYGPEFAGLNIINQCPDNTVTYGLCLTKGSLPQPSGGLPECADDVFLTPLSQLRILTLNFGDIGDFINTTEILFLNVFFCSQSQTLTGPPFTETLQCI